MTVSVASLTISCASASQKLRDVVGGCVAGAAASERLLASRNPNRHKEYRPITAFVER